METTGILNDLLVISKEELYVTTYLPFADNPVTGRDTNRFTSMKRHLMQSLAEFGMVYHVYSKADGMTY